MSNYRVGICILTGGRSTRMGQDKMQLSYNGKKMYEEAAERLNKVAPYRFLSVNGQSINEYPEWICVKDQVEGLGPIGGISSVLEYINALSEDDAYKCDAVLFCAGDMPYFDAKEATSIIEGYSGEDMMVVHAKGDVQPLASVFAVSFLPTIKEEIQNGNYKLRRIIEKAEKIGKYDSENSECYANINTPLEAESVKGIKL